MLKIIKTIVLGATIALGAISAMPAAAQASGSIYLGFGSGDDRPAIGLHFDNRGYYHRRDRRDARGERACTPGEAVRKARRMGLRQAHVVSANRRIVRVRGRTHGYRMAVMTFANRSNCPLIRR